MLPSVIGSPGGCLGHQAESSEVIDNEQSDRPRKVIVPVLPVDFQNKVGDLYFFKGRWTPNFGDGDHLSGRSSADISSGANDA
jgi:hypothetical protein